MPDALTPRAGLARRGPLPSFASVPGVALAPPCRRVALHGALAEFAGVVLPGPMRAATAGETSALWLGPEEWLVLDPAHAIVPAGVSAVDVSHRQIGLLIGGVDPAAMLNAACPLDLDLAAFPVGACTRTVFGKAGIVLWRRDATYFHVEVARSFARYAAELLQAAA